MGLLDFLTSTKRPSASAPVLSPDEVRKRLLNVNRPTAPFQITDGGSEGVDLIAEWKIVDASWREIFSKAGLTKSFKIYMKLHPEDHEVRAVDREYTVSWSAGVPMLALAASAFRGQEQSVNLQGLRLYRDGLPKSSLQLSFRHSRDQEADSRGGH